MSQKKWQIQEAKNKLSELLDRSSTDGPQIITRHGENTAVVLSMKDYQKLQRKQAGSSLLDFFQQSPLKGVSLDIKRSKDIGRNTSLN